MEVAPVGHGCDIKCARGDNDAGLLDDPQIWSGLRETTCHVLTSSEVREIISAALEVHGEKMQRFITHALVAHAAPAASGLEHCVGTPASVPEAAASSRDCLGNDSGSGAIADLWGYTSLDAYIGEPQVWTISGVEYCMQFHLSEDPKLGSYVNSKQLDALKARGVEYCFNYFQKCFDW